MPRAARMGLDGEPTRSEVGVFDDEDAANAAVDDLERSGYPPDDIGVVRDARKAREVVGTRTSELGIVGAIAGFVAGVVILFAPGGELLRSGGASAFLAAGLLGAAAGLIVGVLGGALLPRRDPERYERRLERRGGIVVTVHATDRGRDRARRVLREHGARSVEDERTTDTP